MRIRNSNEAGEIEKAMHTYNGGEYVNRAKTRRSITSTLVGFLHLSV